MQALFSVFYQLFLVSKWQEAFAPGDAAILRFDVNQDNIRADAADAFPGDQIILPGRADPKGPAPPGYDYRRNTPLRQTETGVSDKPQSPPIPDADHFLAVKLRKFTHIHSPLCQPMPQLAGICEA